MNYRIKPIVIALALAGTLALAPCARATSVIGAIEPTQMANNIELVAQYAKQVKQALVQVQQYEAQLKELEQMDPSKMAGMLKGVGGEVAGQDVLRRMQEAVTIDTSLQSISKDMDTLYSEGTVATDVMSLLGSKGTNISPSDYIGMFKALAAAQADTYGKRLTALDSAATDAKSQIQRVDNIAAASKDITSDIQGLQALVQTNAIMASQLSGLQQVLVSSTAMQTDAAKQLANEAAEREAAKMSRDAWMKNNLAPTQGPTQQ